MKKDELIEQLMALVDSLRQEKESLTKQVESLTGQLAALTGELSSLRRLLEGKAEQEAQLRKARKAIKALSGSRSERQAPPVAEKDDEGASPVEEREPSRKTNNGAKRKPHYEVETKVVDVYPDDPSFDKSTARELAHRDVVRYELIPMRFMRVIYRVHKYSQGDTVLEGKAPDAPFLNSNYDGSFIAGLAHLRYMYSMPVERIVKYFNENGFDMEKATAHGLLAKTETLFDGLYKSLREAVKTDRYIAADETYHNVLLRDGGGRGIKRGYIWSTVAMDHGLAYFHYHDGARRSEIFLDFIKGYKGTFQSDGYVTYRTAEGWYDRIGCFQHVKRKFLDCGDDPDAKVIVRLINHIYHLDNKHRIGVDGWTERQHGRWRKERCVPVMELIRKKLDRLAADKSILPKSDKHEAVHYMIGEWGALMGILDRGDFKLDNNTIERLNRYVSLSRRNSLFFGSHKGAERGAMFYSLVCSCRLCGVNFFKYISDVINKAANLPPNAPLSKYRELLPDRWAKGH